MTEVTLSIGEVAARTGLNVSAIRFYERRGLLPEPDRVGGQRRYAPADLRRIGAIAAGRRAGLSLDEIGTLLASTDAGAPVRDPLRVLAADKLQEVDSVIERAQETRAWLLAASACKCETLDACGLFVADLSAP